MAIAFGDVDNDGDQDVFEEMGGAFLADKAYSALYLNPGEGNHWLRLELEGFAPIGVRSGPESRSS